MTHENIERHLINIALEDGDKSVQFLRPILRILGQISLAQEDDVKKIVNAGISDLLVKTLQCHLRQFKRESAWILSNLFASPPDIIDQLLKKNDLMRLLINCLTDTIHDEVKIEVSYCFYNITYCGQVNQVITMLEEHKETIFHSLLESLNGESNVSY